MKVLVLGATGATGRLLVATLLERGHAVVAVVRSPEKLPADRAAHERLTVVEASIARVTTAELARHLRGCDAVASCLGHTLSFRGVFLPPRRLVTDAVRASCAAIRTISPPNPVKIVLMNTAGFHADDIDRPISRAQRAVLGVLRVAVPPHADNEHAARVLRREVGLDDPSIEWCAVRPDALIDADAAGAYDVHPSPTRSAIFDSGRTSRINVAHFMASLIDDPVLWRTWRGRLPVVYDTDPESSPAA